MGGSASCPTPPSAFRVVVTMAGGAAHGTSGGRSFPVPQHFGRSFARFYMAGTVFFIAFRCYYEGGHHFLGHHSWEDPKVIAHLEEVDKKYGSRLAIDNMHH